MSGPDERTDPLVRSVLRFAFDTAASLLQPPVILLIERLMRIEHQTVDGVDVIRLVGDFSWISADAACHIDSLLVARHLKILLNLGRVTRIDAAGLGLLAHVRRVSTIVGAVLVLTDVGPRLRELLDVAGLSPLFDIVASESDALEDLELVCTRGPGLN